MLLHANLLPRGGADLQQQLNVLAIGLVHLSGRIRADVGEPQRGDPLVTEINVVPGVKERAAEIRVERDARPRQTLPKGAFIRPFARHHVETSRSITEPWVQRPIARQFMSWSRSAPYM